MSKIIIDISILSQFFEISSIYAFFKGEVTSLLHLQTFMKSSFLSTRFKKCESIVYIKTISK
jgi:hypothetical protein